MTAEERLAAIKAWYKEEIGQLEREILDLTHKTAVIALDRSSAAPNVVIELEQSLNRAYGRTAVLQGLHLSVFADDPEINEMVAKFSAAIS
jgi:hypothetical protein